MRDTRILSRLELRVNGARPEALAVISDDPFSATFVVAVPDPDPGVADSTLMVFRRRYVGQGMREDLVVPQLRRRAHLLRRRAVRGLGLRRPLRRQRGAGR